MILPNIPYLISTQILKTRGPAHKNSFTGGGDSGGGGGGGGCPSVRSALSHSLGALRGGR